MSSKKQKGKARQGGPKLVKVAPQKCKFGGCKNKPMKFSFCKEHFEMYMAGVLRGDGKKPVDYEQKLSLFLRDQGGKKAA